jgi:hypothetical protein
LAIFSGSFTRGVANNDDNRLLPVSQDSFFWNMPGVVGLCQWILLKEVAKKFGGVNPLYVLGWDDWSLSFNDFVVVIFSLLPITKLPYYPITILPYYHIALLPITILPYYPITLLPYYPITLLSYYPITLLPYYPITILPYYHITILLNYHITQLPYYSITILLNYHITQLPITELQNYYNAKSMAP